MSRIPFVKMVASGNDFVIIENREQRTENRYLTELAKKICDRKYGAGADGLLVLEGSTRADIKMRVFNPDGSEAQMCGNGARCCAIYFAYTLSAIRYPLIKIETKAGILEALVKDDSAKLKMSEPHSMKIDINLLLGKTEFKAHHINSGVPHTVVFVKDVGKIDVEGLGRQIRQYKEFAPAGTNADFVEVLEKGRIAVRTYERGVEAETLACGTGCVAAALIYAQESGLENINHIKVNTKSGEVLEVSFERRGEDFVNVFLEGSARIVYQGSFAAD